MRPLTSSERDLQNREHMRLVDLEKCMKTLKEVVSGFSELATEATHVQTLVRTADLNSSEVPTLHS